VPALSEARAAVLSHTEVAIVGRLPRVVQTALQLHLALIASSARTEHAWYLHIEAKRSERKRRPAHYGADPNDVSQSQLKANLYAPELLNDILLQPAGIEPVIGSPKT
jgi:hypothetical protein